MKIEEINIKLKASTHARCKYKVISVTVTLDKVKTLCTIVEFASDCRYLLICFIFVRVDNFVYEYIRFTYVTLNIYYIKAYWFFWRWQKIVDAVINSWPTSTTLVSNVGNFLYLREICYLMYEVSRKFIMKRCMMIRWCLLLQRILDPAHTVLQNFECLRSILVILHSWYETLSFGLGMGRVKRYKGVSNAFRMKLCLTRRRKSSKL